MADCCSGGIKLIYTCSGSADVGEMADRVARKLRDDGYARMTCLAGVGADLSGFIESAKAADENITIDGCSQTCAAKGLQRIGMNPTSVILSDIGYKKGESPVTQEAIDSIVNVIKSKLPGSFSPEQRGCACREDW